MGFHNSTQLSHLFLSCGLGFLLGFFYDDIHVLRRVITPSKIVRCLCDIGFFALAAVMTFLFSLGVTNGIVRWYVVFGVAVGAVAYRYTVGHIWRRILSRIIAVCRRIGRVVGRIKRRWSDFVRLLLSGIRKKIKKPRFFQKKSCKL